MNCPRCNGRMFAHEEEWGRYAACLSCGHVIWEEPPVDVEHEERYARRREGRRYTIRQWEAQERRA